MVKRNITIDKIEERINQFEKNRIFTISDFLDISTYDATRKALSRMTKSNDIERIINGYYKKINFNKFINRNIPSSADELANAIAKENNWSIGPKGENALNLLSLSTQIPAKHEYLSSGPNRKYEYNNMIIEFRNSSSKYINGKNYKTILLSEALKTIGKERINNNYRNIILSKFNISDLNLILNQLSNSQRWIYEEVKYLTSKKEELSA